MAERNRSTKIVATLGPASSDPTVLERMFRAGVDVVRMNFSHGTADDHLHRAELVRELEANLAAVRGNVTLAARIAVTAAAR